MEDTKVEGTKTKKRSRNVKEVPTERLRTIPSVLFPVILQIYWVRGWDIEWIYLVSINSQKVNVTHLSMIQSPEIQTDLQTIVTRGLTSSWPSRKSAIRVTGSQSSGTRTLRTLRPRVSATCLAIWLRVTSNTRDNKLMDNEGHHWHLQRVCNVKIFYKVNES